MEKVAVGEAEQYDNPNPNTPGGYRVGLALGASDVAINYFELDPGEAFSGGYHTHYDQEEIFHVQSGTARFETEEGPVRVQAGEMIRFAPGEFQHGYNDGDGPLEGFALGAPFGSNDVETLNECPSCGERAYNRRESRLNENASEEGMELSCPECGTEMVQTGLGDGEDPAV